MIDYIVVGFGLAGLAFVETLEDAGKSYVVYEDSSEQSSKVAGGLYNPVVLKRFTAAWCASEQLRLAVPFYERIQDKIKETIVFDLPILRRFNDVEEQNLWFEACDKPILEAFLSPKLIRNMNAALDIPFQYGSVQGTGRIDVKKMLGRYQELLEKKSRMKIESFDHRVLKIESDHIEYQGIKARHIVFAEGFGLRNNPFFNDLPLRGNKGEYIIIKSEELKLHETVKSAIFIIPLGNDLYKVGATYNHVDKTMSATQTAKEELQNKLNRFLKVDYKVVDQVAGIRPTTLDRRPFIGTHAVYKNLHIINGLGTRGILIGPYVAKKLFRSIEKGESLEEEIDIKRFEKL